MHPRAIIEKACSVGLDLIAVCDHNASENAPYVLKASQGKNIKVLPGMEITTSEEVHFISLFDDLDNLAELQKFIDQHLPGQNDEGRFGVQAIVNENGEVEGLSDKLLIGATDVSINDLLDFVHKQNGLAIASHIDRASFSVLSQLGFIHESIVFDALEITPMTGYQKARDRYRELSHYSLIMSSDAHFLKDIGTTMSKIVMAEPTLAELKLAFARQNGRYVME
jgi:hypothetical protein